MVKNQFNARFKQIPAEILSKIAKIDEIKGQWIAGARLSPQILNSLKKSVLITSAGASTRIEGARLSDEDVEKFIKGLAIAKFADRDKQEIKGYYELLDNVFNSWKNIKFSENSIKHFHKELLKYVAKDQAHLGEYKKLDNRMEMFDKTGQTLGIVFATTPPYLTPKEMQELVDWTQLSLKEKKYHPLLIVANFIVEFLKIHPFTDGNGRLSRILTNLLLLLSGYDFMPYISHEKLIEDNKPAYYLALRKSQMTLKSKQADISAWLNFFLDILLKQAELAIELLSQENLEKILSAKQLAVWEYMQKVGQAAPLEIARQAKVARPTINQVLLKLLKLKRIEKIGQGRSTRYRII